MNSAQRRIAKVRLLSVSMCAATLFSITLAHAAETATIENRAFSGSTETGVDLAIKLIAIDATPVAGESAQTQVPAGKRVLEVECATRVFGGMGRADINTKATLSADLQAGRVYQLEAEPSERGDCAPALKAK